MGLSVSIASLHTSESNRRSGLGKFIVDSLSEQLTTELSRHPLYLGPVYIHADCEAYNEVTVKWFTKMGFEPALYCTWMGMEAH